MASPLVVVGPESGLEEASKVMFQYSIRRLPVTKDGMLLGLISAADIAMQMAEERKSKDHRLNALVRYCVSAAASPYK